MSKVCKIKLFGENRGKNSLVQRKIPKSTDKLYQSNGKCDTLPVGQESCKYYFTLALPVGQERDIELDREEQMLRIKAARAES